MDGHSQFNILLACLYFACIRRSFLAVYVVSMTLQTVKLGSLELFVAL
jgi:hypothetical protein